MQFGEVHDSLNDSVMVQVKTVNKHTKNSKTSKKGMNEEDDNQTKIPKLPLEHDVSFLANDKGINNKEDMQTKIPKLPLLLEQEDIMHEK